MDLFISGYSGQRARPGVAFSGGSLWFGFFFASGLDGFYFFSCFVSLTVRGPDTPSYTLRAFLFGGQNFIYIRKPTQVLQFIGAFL